MSYDGFNQLRMFGLPPIFSVSDFCRHTHLSGNSIYQLSKNSRFHYKVIHLQKKDGTQRRIAQPSKRLKGLQAWVLRNILDRVNVSDNCKGFVRGTSILDNARPHIGANVVLTIDLHNFFPNVEEDRVFNAFRTIGYNSLVARILTNLCTFEGGLPQGAPTSPKLANLVLMRLDYRIQGYVGKKQITFTRYADDLTFSASRPARLSKILPTLEKIVNSEGFALNKRKTRVAGISRSKRVTGLVVNDTSVGIGKRKYKKLRARLHKISLAADIPREELSKLQGYLAYVKSVDTMRYKRALRYSQFLFKASSNSALSMLFPSAVRPPSEAEPQPEPISFH